MGEPHRGIGLHPLALLALYVLSALLPLAIAFAQGLPARPFRDELASAMAMIGFAMLLMEFLVSGRFRILSGRIGIDLSMRFHQLVALTLTAFLLLHPWLYTLPSSGGRPGDLGSAGRLGLTGAAAGSGWVAWLLLILLVSWAMLRKQFGYRYETWRLCHGIAGLAIALLGLHHALSAGRYSAHGSLAALWIGLVGIAVLAMVHVYLLRPLLKRRHPYRVVSLRNIALKSWQLTLEPERGDAIAFEPGQFVWLSLNRSPFGITEHPFSMSSCPGDRPQVAFTIKESGDFTSTYRRSPWTRWPTWTAPTATW